MSHARDLGRSQQGAKSAIEGFKYQKKFTSYLCAKMVCRNYENIQKIICEYADDIDVMQSDDLYSYQIKSTSEPILRLERVYESIKLFQALEGLDICSKYILATNKGIPKSTMKTNNLHSLSEFPDLESSIVKKFKRGLDRKLLSRIYLMKGPEIDSIDSIIFEELATRYLHPESVKKDIYSLIESIMGGLDRISVMHIEPTTVRNSRDLEYKTITKRRIEKEILHKYQLSDSDSSVISEYEILTNEGPSDALTDPDEKLIKNLIMIYEHELDLQDNVLKRFQDLSKTSKLYSSLNFMRFLKRLSKSEDKNTILSFLYILHDIVLNSRKYDRLSFTQIEDSYRNYLMKSYSSFEERYLSNHLQIKNMLESLKIGSGSWCILHWNRITNGINHGIRKELIEEIYDDISYLRVNCKDALNKHLKYLQEEDSHIEIKKEVLRYLISH